MNAWRLHNYSQIEDLSYGNYADPECPDDRVLVQIKAAAVNPADLKLISGKDGGKFMHAPNFPIIPGFDFSGLIVNTGASIRDLKKDQEVFGFLPYSRTTRQGTLAEYVAVKPEWIALKPTTVSHSEAAAAATTGSTALQGLRDKGHIIGNQDVLINGASGGVGSYAVQVAKRSETRVWGTCSEKNTDFVRSLGADHVIDYRKKRIEDLEQKFDIIFDAASTTSFNACASRLKRGGVYITLLPSLSLATGKLRSFFSSKASSFVVVKPRSKDLAQLAAWLSDGSLKSPIGASFDFGDAPNALLQLKNGVAGKVVVTNEHTT